MKLGSYPAVVCESFKNARVTRALWKYSGWSSRHKGQPLVKPARPPRLVQIARLCNRQSTTIEVGPTAFFIDGSMDHRRGREACGSLTSGVEFVESCSEWAIRKALEGHFRGREENFVEMR